jgi:hypothetical protein
MITWVTVPSLCCEATGRELREATSAVATQSGVPAGACFWKNDCPSTPSGYRLRVIGRPATCGSSTGEIRW